MPQRRAAWLRDVMAWFRERGIVTPSKTLPQYAALQTEDRWRAIERYGALAEAGCVVDGEFGVLPAPLPRRNTKAARKKMISPRMTMKSIGLLCEAFLSWPVVLAGVISA